MSIGTLRRTYGLGYAKAFADAERLTDVLHKLDEPSFSQLIKDHGSGTLERVRKG